MFFTISSCCQGRLWSKWCVHGDLLSAGEAEGGGNGGHLPVHPNHEDTAAWNCGGCGKSNKKLQLSSNAL